MGGDGGSVRENVGVGAIVQFINRHETQRSSANELKITIFNSHRNEDNNLKKIFAHI